VATESHPLDPKLQAWTRGHALIALAGLGAAALLGPTWPLVVLTLASFIALWIVGYGAWTPRGGPGLANGVTAVRLALALALALLGRGGRGEVLAAVVITVLLLDGLDGWLARRRGTASAFGAHFDMETDALLVLVVGLVLWQRGPLGAWILLPGMLRYLYVLCLALVPPRGGEMPRSRFGRHAFTLLILGFTIALAFSGELATSAAALGSAAVGVSFGRSVYWSYFRAT
jgi:phosphatidylglycerophosphate synthase